MSTPPWYTRRPHGTVPAGVAPGWANASNWLVKNITVNVIEADLTHPSVSAVPAVAAKRSTAPLPGIAAQPGGSKLLAGINGGYFFRVDEGPHWTDDVCVGKTYSEALHNVSAAGRRSSSSDGIGDTLVKLNGNLLSRNCDNVGFSRPAALVLDRGAARVELLRRGQDLPATVSTVIAASPRLVTSSGGGPPQVHIPADDDNTGNIEEHAANTGAGLRDGGKTLVLVTVDGVDDCSMLNATCGVNAVQLAFLMKDALAVDDAMQMDQGGSTTMWVRGQPNGGVVSRNEWAPRSIYSALFVAWSGVRSAEW